MADYFSLTTSDSMVTKKFKVIFGNYANILEKAQSIDKTIDGKLDISVGSIHERYAVTVRVRHTELDIDFGNEADLRYFFSLNNPNGTPSNHINMVDHYGNGKTVVMMGDYNAQVQGIMIIGIDAWYVINCMFMVIDAVVEGS